MRTQLPGLNKAEQDVLLTFRVLPTFGGSSHLNVRTLSATSPPPRKQLYFFVSGSWFKRGKLLLQPADPFSQRSLPFTTSFPPLQRLQKRENTRTRIHGVRMPCHKYLCSRFRAGPWGYKGLGDMGTQAGFQLVLGSTQAGLETLPQLRLWEN